MMEELCPARPFHLKLDIPFRNNGSVETRDYEKEIDKLHRGQSHLETQGISDGSKQ